MDKIDFILQSLTNGDEIKIRKYMAKLANLFCLAKYREDKYVRQTLSFLGDIMRSNNFSLEIQADIFRCFSNIIKNEKYMDDVLKLKPLHLCKNILWNFQPNTNLIKNVCRFLLKVTNIHNIKQMYLYDDLAYIVVSLYNAVPYLDTLDDKQLYYDQLNTVLLRMFLVITGKNLSESSKTAKRTKLLLLNTSGFFDTTNTPFESLLNPEFLNNLQVNLFANVTNDLDAKTMIQSLTLYDLFIQMLGVSEINHAFGTVGLVKVLFVLLRNHYSANNKSLTPYDSLHNTLNLLILIYHLSLESSNRARIRDFGGLILLLDLANWFLRCDFGLKTTNFCTIDDHILTTFVAIFKNFLYDTLSAHVLMSHGIFHFLNGVLKHFLDLPRGKFSKEYGITPLQQDIELEINSNQHSDLTIENNDYIKQVKKDVDLQTLDYQSIVHSFIGYETLFEAFSTNRYLNPLVVVLENNDNNIVDTCKNRPCDSPNDDSRISPTCTINSSPHNSEYCFSVSSQSPKYNYYFGSSPSHYSNRYYASPFSNSPGSSTGTGVSSSYYGSLLSSPTYTYFDNNQYGGTANYINVSAQSSCCQNDYSSEEEFYIEELSSTASFNNNANDKMDIMGQGIGEANMPTNTTDVSSIIQNSAKSDHPNLKSSNEMKELQNLSIGSSHNTDLPGTTNLNTTKAHNNPKHCLKRDVSTTLQDAVTILLFQLKMMETPKYLGKNIELFHTLMAFLMSEDKIKPPPKILIKTLLRLVKDTRYTHILMQCGIPPLIYALKVYHDVHQSLCCTSSIATISDEHKFTFFDNTNNNISHKSPKIKRRKMNENGGSSKNLMGYLTKLLKCLQQSFRDAQAIDYVKKVLQTCDMNTDYRMSQSDMLVLLSLPFLESKNGFKRILHDYNYVTRLHTLITSQPYYCLKGGYLFDHENEYDQNGLPDYQNSSTSCYYIPYILLAIHYINQNIPNSTYGDTNLHNVCAKNLTIPKLIAFAHTLLKHDRTHKIILNGEQEDVQGNWDWILRNTKSQQNLLPEVTQKLPIESIVYLDLNQAPESYKLLLREQSQFFATLLSCGDAAFFSEHHKPNEIILKDISMIDFANVLHYLRMYHNQEIMSPSSPYVILASTYFPTHIVALIEKFLSIYRYSHRFLLIELECWIRTYVIPSLVLFYCSNFHNIDADIYCKTYSHHLTTISEVIDMICTYYTEYYLLEALNDFKEFVVRHWIFLATFNATPIDVIYNFPYMFDFGPQSRFFDSIFDCYNNAVIQL